MHPVQKHTRSAVRSLAAAALACNGASQPTRKARLAKLALQAYELATEYDTDFYLSGPDYERLRESAASQAQTYKAFCRDGKEIRVTIPEKESCFDRFVQKCYPQPKEELSAAAEELAESAAEDEAEAAVAEVTPLMEQAANEAEVAEFARSHNLVEWETGGGCSALGFQWTDLTYALFTEPEDPTAPLSLGTPVACGWYDAQGEQLLEITFPSLSAAYEALDDGWEMIWKLQKSGSRWDASQAISPEQLRAAVRK